MPICQTCGANNRPGAKFCLHCGRPLVATRPSFSRQYRVLIATGGLLLLLLLVASLLAVLRSEDGDTGAAVRATAVVQATLENNPASI